MTLDDTKLGDVAAAGRVRSIHVLAWRDLEDAEAGGSELHIDEIARRWAAAGIDVTMRTSFAAGRAVHSRRHGYRVIRKAGRYLVFPRAAVSERLGWHGGDPDVLVEIWNGMPFFSPVWSKTPRVVFLHHVHAEMWKMVLPPRLARLGNTIESRIAPLFYRRTQIVTLSESSKQELVEQLGFKAKNVHVVPPGISEVFRPGTTGRSPTPLVVAVGRLVPVKRFDELIAALAELKPKYPGLRAVIVGEGYERDVLEARRAELGADDWISLPGHVSDDELIRLYQQTWVLASTSLREGWGMTITEAAACGAPAVVTDIAGHRDAVADGVSGRLADVGPGYVAALDSVLGDDELRDRLSRGALVHAQQFTWDRTALDTLIVLANEARRR